MSVALDTNVLLRFLTRDDPKKHYAAARLISRQTCFVLDTVLLELEWVLRKTFGYDRQQIAAVLDVMTNSAGLKVENQLRLSSALSAYRSGMDFADAFHLAGAAETAAFATFDRQLIKRASRSFAKPPVIHP